MSLDAYEISDDDDSFDPNFANTLAKKKGAIFKSNDKSSDINDIMTSDSDEEYNSPLIHQKRISAVTKLFAKSKKADKNSYIEPNIAPIVPSIPEPGAGVKEVIGGVTINFPVEPYGCQRALMSTVVKAMKNSQNCLLESPTGTGKTLALLCATLAWQISEKNNIAQRQAQNYFADHPELNKVDGASQYLGNSVSSCQEKSGDLFNKPIFGEKSIYDEISNKTFPENCDGSSLVPKRLQPDNSPDNLMQGEVRIHKRRRRESTENSNCSSPKIPATPEKVNPPQTDPESPSQNLRVPIIYYGARTHKQLQQVIKEFKRTAYCGRSNMTVLSSREYSCIREYDSKQWKSKNEMCRSCINPLQTKKGDKKQGATNCRYYDNRNAISRRRLGAAFDLEELVATGRELSACPYYASRDLAKTADIVFCPYNYLIDPAIRSSLQIDLKNNIVIIDEGHNIEDICRDAATFTITRDQVQSAVKELEVVNSYKFSNDDTMSYTENLLRTLKDWDYWFENNIKFLSNEPTNNNEYIHKWNAEHFVTTLNNHNIGTPQYNQFKSNVEMFSRKFQEDAKSLIGATQATLTLLETIDAGLGYLFRENCQFVDDFKPVLVRSTPSEYSQRFSQNTKDVLCVRVVCLNPGVVFPGGAARGVLLASGTLAPLHSLHSELQADFKLRLTLGHVIKRDRVWIGSLISGRDGSQLECTSRYTARTEIQDDIGLGILKVCGVTPHGVLCFLPSYSLMNKLINRWKITGMWQEMEDLKYVFIESRNVRDHDTVMKGYYKQVETSKGALLFAVYRGKVSEGMDFKDHQARAVIAVGIPYPNSFDVAVQAKMQYNDKYYKQRNLIDGNEWLKVQAYRALNQALGRCVRHCGDWGAVLLLDARYAQPHYTQHLSKWVRAFLGNNHHSIKSLISSTTGIETFMQNMKIEENNEQSN